MGRGGRSTAAPGIGSRGPSGGGGTLAGRAGIGSAANTAPSRGLIGPAGGAGRHDSSRDSTPRAPIGARSAYRSRECLVLFSSVSDIMDWQL